MDTPARVDFDERTVFRSLFVAYPDALLVVDAGGVIVMANPSAAALLGYAVEELTGLNVDVLVPDSIRPRHAAYREAYGRAPRSRPMGTQMELVAKRQDGSEVMVEIALSPLQNQGLPFVVAAIRDIGAYPRVKQALQRARYSEHLADLGQRAVDARDPQILQQQIPAKAAEALQVDRAMVLLAERELAVLRVVGRIGTVAGEEPGASIACAPGSWPALLMAQGLPLVVEDLRLEKRFVVPQTYLDAGLTSALGVPILDRGRVIGAIWVASHEPRHFGEDEQRFLGSLASLLATSLQRSEAEEALNHAQRLESVGQLTGGIAHDFNNLLTVIQGNLQVLKELPALERDGHAQQLVSAAARASRRGAELTGKLLAFSRRQVLQPKPVDVAAMLQSLADMLRRTLDQRVVIEVEAQACPLLLADAGQLEAALLNIAINARDAMPDGGLLRFRCEPCDALPAELHGELGAADVHDLRFVAISITDNGVGMPEEVREHVFEPFFTTKEAGRGTGLGLSTVYGFVKQSRGAVAIDSSVGKGTTLTLYLPQAVAANAPASDDAAESEELRPGLRVMLVEDDPEVLKVVRLFLQTLGCVVSVATSAEEALPLLQAGEPPDLLLSDIALGPGMRGTQLAAEVQQRLPDMAVLLMSGYSSDLLEADRDSPPSWELLRKPYSRSELARAMVRVLANHEAGG